MEILRKRSSEPFPARCTLHTRRRFHSRECAELQPTLVYLIELAIKMSPMPVSVQRKEQAAAETLYQQVRQTMEQGQPRLLELSCEKMEGKRVSVLSSEVLAVQIYEKTATGGGSKRPGFAFDG